MDKITLSVRKFADKYQKQRNIKMSKSTIQKYIKLNGHKYLNTTIKKDKTL